MDNADSCETYHMMNKNILSEYNNPDREIQILTRSPSQYPDYDKPDDILSIDKYKECVDIFDDMLENKQRDICPFFTRGRHEGISV